MTGATKMCGARQTLEVATCDATQSLGDWADHSFDTLDSKCGSGVMNVCMCVACADS